MSLGRFFEEQHLRIKALTFTSSIPPAKRQPHACRKWACPTCGPTVRQEQGRIDYRLRKARNARLARHKAIADARVGGQ